MSCVAHALQQKIALRIWDKRQNFANFNTFWAISGHCTALMVCSKSFDPSKATLWAHSHWVPKTQCPSHLESNLAVIGIVPFANKVLLSGTLAAPPSSPWTWLLSVAWCYGHLPAGVLVRQYAFLLITSTALSNLHKDTIRMWLQWQKEDR